MNEENYDKVVKYISMDLKNDKINQETLTKLINLINSDTSTNDIEKNEENKEKKSSKRIFTFSNKIWNLRRIPRNHPPYENMTINGQISDFKIWTIIKWK